MDDLNKKIESIKTSIKNIKMTDAERRTVLKNIFNQKIISPYFSFSFYFSRMSVLALVFVLILSGTGLSYAAENSLPGDPLYPLKVNVTEPLRDIINITAAEKAQWEETKAVRRLDEAQALVQVDKFSPEAAADLETRFSEHAKAFSSAINSLSTSSPQAASELNANFKAKVKIHSQKIERKSSNSKIQVGSREEDDTQIQPQNIIEVRSAVNISAESQTKNEEDGSDQNKKNDNVNDFLNHIEQEVE